MAGRLSASLFPARRPARAVARAPALRAAARVSASLFRSGTFMTSPVTYNSKQEAGRCVQAHVAYHPSLDIPVHDAVQRSIDLDEVALDGWIPGKVFEVSSVQQIRDLAVEAATDNRKAILMCKSKSCRPCKAFSVKFKRLAAQHTDTMFLSVTGESSMELRDLMIGMKIRNTPTFLGFWQKAIVHRHSGISKEKMETVLDSDWQQFADELQEKDAGDSLLLL